MLNIEARLRLSLPRAASRDRHLEQRKGMLMVVTHIRQCIINAEICIRLLRKLLIKVIT